MSDNRFDDFLKQSFSDYSPQVPAHIWDNIAGRKQKRRPLFFWISSNKLLVAAASLLLTGGGIFYFTSQSNNDHQNYTQNNAHSGNNNIAHENTNSRQDAATTAPAPVLDNAAADNNAAASANTNSGVPAADNKNDLGVSPGTKENAAKDVLNKVNTGNGKRTGTIDLLQNQDNDAADKSPVTNKRAFRLRRTAVTHIVTGSPAEDNGQEEAPVNSSVEETTNMPDVAGRRDLIYMAIENLLAQKSTQVNPVKLREDCPGNTSGNNYYFDVYLAPDHVIKKYSDTGNSIQVARRKESLKIQSAYSAGLRYTRVFANGISIRTGFNYSQVNEKFSYAVDNVVHIVYVINNQGDTTDSYYVRGTRYRNSFNRYRTIDVPVVMGYEMGNGKFHANINAGLMVNVYSWQSGETLDNNGTPVSITTGKADNPYQYKTNIGLGFTGAVSLYYKITDRLHIMAEPYFRYSLAPMNKDALSLQERFTTMGLRLGVRVDIR